jgi:hypothetical protein
MPPIDIAFFNVGLQLRALAHEAHDVAWASRRARRWTAERRVADR